MLHRLACIIWSLKEDQSVVLLLFTHSGTYYPAYYLVNFGFFRPCFPVLLFRPFIYSEVKINPSLFSAHFSFFLLPSQMQFFNLSQLLSTQPPNDLILEKALLWLKESWQNHCAMERRNRAKLRWGKKWGMIDDSLLTKEPWEYGWLCLLVSCLLVFPPPERIYLTFFIFSLLRMSIYTSDFSSMNKVFSFFCGFIRDITGSKI